MVRPTGKVAGRSSSNAESASKPERRRRRRIFGDNANTSTKNEEEQGQGRFADDVWYRVTNLFWGTRKMRTTPNRSDVRIGRRARGYNRAGEAGDSGGWMPKGATVIVILPLLAITAAAALFLVRRRARAATDARRPRREGEGAETERGECETKQGGDRCGGEARQGNSGSPGERSLRADRDAQSMNNPPPRGRAGDSAHAARPEQYKKLRSAVVPTSTSGERRVRLYDVLTGEAALMPSPRDDGRTGIVSSTAAPGSSAAAGGLGPGPGPGPGLDPPASLGGARRASIFDRIADIVFDEENETRDLVDEDAVRQTIGDEFRVSFREGAMGMTLSMDSGTRNALVGKVVSQGQAFRAGVQTGDLVIGVGEHNVSSYGTVLAFMNILGRPIELRFRKVESAREGRSAGGSSGRGVSTIPSTEASGRGRDGDSAALLGSSTKSGSGSSLTATGGSWISRSRENSLIRKTKVAPREVSKKTLLPISPRSASRFSGLGGLRQEVASSNSSFVDKMEHGVVVTKYGKKGAASQRVLFLDGATKSLAWRDLSARSPGHRRFTPSFASLLKGQRETLALSHLVEVVAGDEPDPARPSLNGSLVLRENCDESLVERSFSLQFRERSLEMTCDSKAEMRQLVTGFRDLQRKFGA